MSKYSRGHDTNLRSYESSSQPYNTGIRSSDLGTSYLNYSASPSTGRSYQGDNSKYRTEPYSYDSFDYDSKGDNKLDSAPGDVDQGYGSLR